jgi:hypothetical protein
MNDPPKLTVWFPADRGREHQIEPIGDCQTRGAGRGIEPESRDDIVFRQRPVDEQRRLRPIRVDVVRRPPRGHGRQPPDQQLDWTRPNVLELTTSFRFAESTHGVPVFVGGDRFVRQERLVLSGTGFPRGHEREHGAPLLRRLLLDRFAPDRRRSSALITAGAAYERETLDQRVGLAEPLPGATPRTEASRDVRSTYLQTQLDWKKRVFLTPGFRVDDSSIFGTEITPHVAAAWIVPVSRTKLRAAYGEGVKAPSFAQIVGDGGLGVIVGNPALRPERARSWEIGVDQPFPKERGKLPVNSSVHQPPGDAPGRAERSRPARASAVTDTCAAGRARAPHASGCPSPGGASPRSGGA